jgi:prophage DNA circulation protein
MASPFTPFDGLAPAEFGGIRFPVSETSYIGMQRVHAHEYPHTDGAAIERLGRAPYRIRVVAVFDAGIKKFDQFNGTELWPGALEKLRGRFETREPGTLKIPTLPPIERVVLTNITVTMRAGVRSGEQVELEFTEDSTEQYLVELAETVPKSIDGVQTVAAEAITLIEGEKFSVDDFSPDFLDGLVTFRDQVSLIADDAATKLLQVARVCEEIDRTAKGLQNPENWRIVEAVKQVWKSASDLAATLTADQSPLLTYIVPKKTSVQDLSMQFYGTTEKVRELMSLNVIEDSLAIPAGTVIQYVDPRSL